MIRFRVKLTQNGVADYQNRILRIGRIREVFVNRASGLILETARSFAPHDTGELRRSGHIEEVTRSAKTTTDAVVFRRTAPWGAGEFDVAKWTHDPEEFTRSTYIPSDPN